MHSLATRGLLCLCVAATTGCVTHRYTEPPSDAASADIQLPVVLQEATSDLDMHYGPELSRESHPNLPAWELEDNIALGMEQQLETWTVDETSTTAPLARVRVERNEERCKPNTGLVVVTVLSLGLVPTTADCRFDSVVTVQSGNRRVYRNETASTTRTSIGLFAPLMGQRGYGAYQEMSASTLARQKADLAQWMSKQVEAYSQVKNEDILARQQWLVRHPDTLFRGEILHDLAENPPSKNVLAWHGENIELFPDYAQYFPDDKALWFVGPSGHRVIDILNALRQGQDVDVIAARIQSAGGTYRSFSGDETQVLADMGLPSSLIVAMMDASASNDPARGPTAADVRQQRPDVASLVIAGNSGKYMNPWTSDGVLAEWVDKAINAEMGAATGSAIGAAAGSYAANKVLENVPFGSMLGGMLGSEMGKAAGRQAAIEASGGMDYIRSTSDQSFDSLNDMALYILANYAGTSHYQDAVKAADAIYPGLQQAVAQASR